MAGHASAMTLTLLLIILLVVLAVVLFGGWGGTTVYRRRVSRPVVRETVYEDEPVETVIEEDVPTTRTRRRRVIEY